MDLEARIQLCRVVGAMILVDGELSDAEVHFIADLMERLDLTTEAQEEVMNRLEDDPEILSDIALLRPHKDILLKELRNAARADGMDVDEAVLIQRVEEALG